MKNFVLMLSFCVVSITSTYSFAQTEDAGHPKFQSVIEVTLTVPNVEDSKVILHKFSEFNFQPQSFSRQKSMVRSSWYVTNKTANILLFLNIAQNFKNSRVSVSELSVYKKEVDIFIRGDLEKSISSLIRAGIVPAAIEGQSLKLDIFEDGLDVIMSKMKVLRQNPNVQILKEGEPFISNTLRARELGIIKTSNPIVPAKVGMEPAREISLLFELLYLSYEERNELDKILREHNFRAEVNGMEIRLTLENDIDAFNRFYDLLQNKDMLFSFWNFLNKGPRDYKKISELKASLDAVICAKYFQ